MRVIRLGANKGTLYGNGPPISNTKVTYLPYSTFRTRKICIVLCFMLIHYTVSSLKRKIELWIYIPTNHHSLNLTQHHPKSPNTNSSIIPSAADHQNKILEKKEVWTPSSYPKHTSNVSKWILFIDAQTGLVIWR